MSSKVWTLPSTGSTWGSKHEPRCSSLRRAVGDRHALESQGSVQQSSKEWVMANSERVATAAHLHVALRRKAGRVTDTDWMAENDDYAREVVRVARAKAREDGDAQLADLASKLEALLPTGAQLVSPSVPPLAQRASRNLRESNAPGAGDAERYIGCLR